MAASSGEKMEPSKPSWAQIVEDTRAQINTKLDYFEPLALNGNPLVAPPEEVRLEGSSFWTNCLVGHFVGKRPVFPVVNAIAKKLWSKDGLQEVIAQENGFIFFLFDSEGALNAILERGPWFIAGRFLVLKKWERNLNLSVEASLSTIPVWALLYNVPVELWTQKGLSYISSALGRPLFADLATLSRKRLNYARVCIEIDAKSPLIEEFALASGASEDPYKDPILIKVLYQWKPSKCSLCRVFGHSNESCAANPISIPDPKGKALANPGPQPSHGWSRFTRQGRPGRRGGGSYGGARGKQASSQVKDSNQFKVLGEIQSEDDLTAVEDSVTQVQAEAGVITQGVTDVVQDLTSSVVGT